MIIKLVQNYFSNRLITFNLINRFRPNDLYSLWSSDVNVCITPSGPCTPEALQSYRGCEDSLGSVSWSMFADAESYLAVAVGKDGHTHQCASNTTSCTWDDLHCGEIYTVNVVALDYHCTSLHSNSTTIRMGKYDFKLCNLKMWDFYRVKFIVFFVTIHL